MSKINVIHKENKFVGVIQTCEVCVTSLSLKQ